MLWILEGRTAEHTRIYTDRLNVALRTVGLLPIERGETNFSLRQNHLLTSTTAHQIRSGNNNRSFVPLSTAMLCALSFVWVPQSQFGHCQRPGDAR